RFSVRAVDVTVDASVLWVGTALAIAAAILLAFVPRLPSTERGSSLGLTSSSVRLTPSTNRRLRAFATVQIAFSFVLLVGAGMLMKTLVRLETVRTGIDLGHVEVFDIPPVSLSASVINGSTMGFYDETMRRVQQLPGVDAVSLGMFVPWRDAGSLGAGLAYRGEKQTIAPGGDIPRARMRIVPARVFR